jgi:O-antigen/teichoic acid export membrane protein
VGAVSDAPDEHDVLRSDQAAGRVVRGGAQRLAAYGAGILLTAGASVVLLRHLGVERFGEYVTVMSLIAIVAGVTDAGLTAVGARELALREPGEPRQRLVANTVGIRLVLVPIGVVLATLFALLAGYPDVVVLGTLIAGFGLVIGNTQAAMTMPLTVELRNDRLALADLIRTTVMMVFIAALAVAGAALLPFFTAQIVAGVVLVALTPWLMGRRGLVRPRLDHAEVRHLLLESLPLAISLALSQVYFRILIVMISLMLTARETGLFGTSYRILEMMLLVPTVVFGVVLPVTSVASAEDEGRLRYVTQRVTEVALVAGVGLAVVIAIVAEPAIVALGGDEYRDAAGVLRIQVFALVGFFLNQAWSIVLISIRRQRAIAVANGIALVVLVALAAVLIPSAGIEGAAAAAVAADAVLALILLGALIRARPGIAPQVGFAPKVVLAGGLAAAAVLLPGLPALAEGTIAAIVYAAAAWLLGLVPSEVRDALRRTGPAGPPATTSPRP